MALSACAHLFPVGDNAPSLTAPLKKAYVGAKEG